MMRSQCAVLMLVGVLLNSPASAQPNSDKIRDLLVLMGAALFVPGTAAYCEKRVASTPALMAAAEAWNRRHWKIMEAIVREIEATGGLSAEQKRQIDTTAFKALSQEIEAESDRVAFCREAARTIETGVLDLDQRPDTSAVLAKLGLKK